MILSIDPTQNHLLTAQWCSFSEMNIDILRTFLSVAKTRNFTKSAEENFCTQSTASLRIQSLEEYF